MGCSVNDDKSWDRWLKNYYNPKPKKKNNLNLVCTTETLSVFEDFNFLDYNVKSWIRSWESLIPMVTIQLVNLHNHFILKTKLV